MKKLFGGIDLTWKKLIIFAVIAGVYTGITTLIPGTMDTSIRDISITFEWWILFGIIIITNSRSNLDSGLKCIVFFLISQPLVYLVQVPFVADGWTIFRYYPGWFRWTLLTFPMGYIGYYLKKDKWWGMFILGPVMVFLGFHYMGFLREAVSFFPNHLLSTIFCLATMIIYPLYIFSDPTARKIGLALSIVVLLATSVLAISDRKNSVYSTEIISSSEEHYFDETYKVYLTDDSYGTVSFKYIESIDALMVHAEFTRTGSTQLIIEAPDGTRQIYDLDIRRSSYDINRVK